AVVEGLAPESNMLNRLFRVLNLERGLVLGALVFFAGLFGSLYTVGAWGQAHFGPIDPTVTFRTAIPSVVGLTLGLELMLASLFLSMLGLRVRRSQPIVALESRPEAARSVA